MMVIDFTIKELALIKVCILASFDSVVKGPQEKDLTPEQIASYQRAFKNLKELLWSFDEKTHGVFKE